MFIRFERIHERDKTQTDGQTPDDDIGHACIALRGKKVPHNLMNKYVHT